MSETDKYGNGPLSVGFSHTVQGVSLHMRHPDTGEVLKVFTVDPEFARAIAQNLTLESFACDDLRRKTSGAG